MSETQPPPAAPLSGARRTELVRFAIALALPLLVLLFLIGRGEFISRSGQKWRVRITGYDPRDLVHGQYLRYRLQWVWERSEPDRGNLPDDAIYCLTTPTNGRRPPEPTVDVVPRSDRARCRSWFPVETEERLNRFYIPEGKGSAFERAVRNETCYVVLAISRTGQVVVEDLLINDTSWRQVLRD